MTNDQEARCAALAKRIAELDPNWAMLGCACRDTTPDSYPDIWRALPHARGGVRWLPQCQSAAAHIERNGYEDDWEECESRAIANGPDYTDDATLGALLWSFGECTLISEDKGGFSVTIHDFSYLQAKGETRAEAILAAKVAQLEQEAKSNG